MDTSLLKPLVCRHRLEIIRVEEMPKAHGRRITYRCVRCGDVICRFKRNQSEKGT